MIFLFNPEHDLALGNFSPNYTPPASAAAMGDELALLPLWYAQNHPVVAEDRVNRLYLEAVQRLFPDVSSSLFSYGEIADLAHHTIVPWGWNPALRKRLLLQGVQEDRLPSIKLLGQLRDYSNRKHAVRMLAELQHEEANFYGASHHFSSLDNLLVYLDSFEGDKMLKMPISGSGKGLIRVLGRITDKQTDWCRRVMHAQGGVVAEPLLEKAVDFAMEFYLDAGRARFAGYSLFHTADSGAYLGNELISDRKVLEKLSKYVPIPLMQELQGSLLNKLAVAFPHYTGYAGVDMMICETEQGYRVQPCVEINMRINMGVVARIFHSRFMRENDEGLFRVDYFKKRGGAWQHHLKMSEEHPPIIEQGRITSGYLALTPITEATRYAAYVLV